jgi:hypothetical protein
LAGIFDVVFLVHQRFHQRYPSNRFAMVADSISGLAQMLRMVVSVNSVDHLNGHPKKSGGLPLVHASLHQPRGNWVKNVVPKG